MYLFRKLWAVCLISLFSGFIEAEPPVPCDKDSTTSFASSSQAKTTQESVISKPYYGMMYSLRTSSPTPIEGSDTGSNASKSAASSPNGSPNSSPATSYRVMLCHLCGFSLDQK